MTSITTTNMHQHALLWILGALTGFVSLSCAHAQDASERGRRISAPPSQPVVTRFERDIARRHDRGLMIHAEAGLGYGSAPGLGAYGSLGIGWLPWEDMAVSLEAWGARGADGGVVSAGPGFTYFVPESALHLRVAAGLGATALHDAHTDLSVAGSFGLGITPYITPHASLGLGVLVAGTLGDLDGDGVSRAGFLVGLSLSWTLN